MTTNYYCDLATDADLDDVAARTATYLDSPVQVEGAFRRIATTVLFAQIKTITDPRRREWFFADWLIDSRVRISFWLDEKASEQEQFAGLRQLCITSVRLAEDLGSDAILRYDGDALMMRRKDGTLALRESWAVWADPETVAALPGGYTLTSNDDVTSAEPTQNT